MGLSIFYKWLIGGSCAAGGVCAVSLPIALTSGVSNPNLTTISDLTQVSSSLQECPFEGVSTGTKYNLEAIQFGEGDIKDKNICGTVDYTEDDERRDLATARYANLFEKMWENKNVSRAQAESQGWTSKCSSGVKHGELVKENGQKEYLGICPVNALNEEQGVEVDRQNNNELKLKICNQKCWSDRNSGAGVVERLQNLDTGWKEASFKRISVSADSQLSS